MCPARREGGSRPDARADGVALAAALPPHEPPLTFPGRGTRSTLAAWRGGEGKGGLGEDAMTSFSAPPLQNQPILPPQVFYHLGELDDALTYALLAGPKFDVADTGDYVQSVLGE